ncbi:MAG: hypothetical protein HYV96_01680 [Opitutae bacterium]|nr:hypothetical protein [Opitutae bacterium]
MKLQPFLGCFGGVALASALAAQTTVPVPADAGLREFGPHRGDRELIIGGSGGADRSFDNSFGGATVSYGYFVSDSLSSILRQSINYSNPEDTGSQWNGATRFAVDQHFLEGPLRPFLGANVGRIYGERVRDSWVAGLEGGMKYYVQPRTFLHATIEYGWLFQHARSIDDRFDNGQWNWSLGVGFNF